MNRVVRCVGRPAAAFALALGVFLGWLGARDVNTSHEARVAQTARLMAASGWPWAAAQVDAAPLGVRGDADGHYAAARYDRPPVRVNPWLVPVLNGRVRLQKPPLPYWCTAVLYRLIGVSEFATRLVPALMGAMGTLLVGDLARLLYGRRAAWLARLVWLGTFFVAAQYREATADPYLAFFTLAAVWAWVRAGETGGRASRLLLAFYTSLALGALSKGPFVFLHVGLALGAYHVCHRRGMPGNWTLHAGGVGLMLALALPWPLHVASQADDVVRLWAMESTRGGAAGWGDVLRTAGKYPLRLPDLALPWTPVWLLGIASVIRRGGRHRSRLFPLAWCAATVAAFSLSAEKKSAYLLPMMPAMTLLAALGLWRLLASSRLAGRGRWAVPLGVVQGGVIVAFVPASLVVMWQWGRWSDVARGAGLALVAAAVAALAARRRVRADASRWLAAQGVLCAAACVLWVGHARAARDNERSAKAFGALVGPRLLPPADVLVSGIPEEASFYLPLGMRYRPDATELYDVAEPPRRGQAFDLNEHYRPVLPHGRLVRVEVVPLDGEPTRSHWRLLRLTVDPSASGEVPGRSRE